MSQQILETIKAEIAAFDEKRKALVKELQTQFPSMFVELFKQAPNLESIGWTQYTPYFNDGDTCEFGVHTDDLYLNGVNLYDDSDLDFSINIYNYAELKTEADLLVNEELAEKTGRTWYKGKQLGQQGMLYNAKYDPDAAKAVAQIQEVLNSIPESFFLDLFGDHCMVTISADGTIDVESYDHD